MEISAIISSGFTELYVAGLTSKEETRAMEGWLLRYPEIAKELAMITANVEAYAQIFALQPDPAVKKRVFSKINKPAGTAALPIAATTIKGTRKVPGKTHYWRIVAAASIALLIVSIAVDLLEYPNYLAMNRELAVTHQTLSLLEKKDKYIEESLAIVKSRYSVPVALKGLAAAPNAVAKIFWLKNTGEVFIDAANLPEQPPGRQYQLWGFVNGKPVDGGLIVKSNPLLVFPLQKMKSFTKAEAFAVSLEAEKGSTTPKGPIYVMGKL